jgi:putative ABC transport system substrate-binding protein
MLEDSTMRRSVIGIIVALVLTILLALWASDSQAAKVPLIGFLSETDLATTATVLEPFRHGLRARGYVEGQTMVLEARRAEGRLDWLPDLATELVQRKVDLLVAVGARAAQAAQHATRTIPIVAFVGDPVEMGLVASLARPGGNVTGVSGQSTAVSGKMLELLKEAVPQASRVAVLWNPANPNKVLEWQETQRAAQASGVTLHSMEVRTPDDFEHAFAALTRGRADAFVEAGGLMSYGVKPRDLYGRLAVYVDKILKGAKPADLPVEQLTKFELVINLKTAQALGITMPPSLLLLVEEVIR